MRSKQVKNLEPFEQMVKVVAAEKVLAKKRMRARRETRRFSAPSRAADLAN